MIKLYEFLRGFEYHKEDKLIFINFHDTDELFKLLRNKYFEDGLECHINCGSLVFDVEELIDSINSDWTEEIIEMLNTLTAR